MELKRKCRSPSQFVYHRELSKALLGRISNGLRTQTHSKYSSLQANGQVSATGSPLMTTSSYEFKLANHFDSCSKHASKQETYKQEQGKEAEKNIPWSKNAVSQSLPQIQGNPYYVPQKAGDETNDIRLISNEEDYGTLFASDIGHSYDLINEKNISEQLLKINTVHDFRSSEERAFDSAVQMPTYYATFNDFPYASKSCSNRKRKKSVMSIVSQGTSESPSQQITAQHTVTETAVPVKQATSKGGYFFPVHESSGSTQYPNVYMSPSRKTTCTVGSQSSSINQSCLQTSGKDLHLPDNRNQQDGKWSLTYVASPTILNTFIRSDWSRPIIPCQSKEEVTTVPETLKPETGQKPVREIFSSSNSPSFKPNYYIKREDVQHPLQTHKCMKDDKDITHNPYYAFLPEYTYSTNFTTTDKVDRSEVSSVTTENVQKSNQNDKLSLRREFLQNSLKYISCLAPRNDSKNNLKSTLSPYYAMLNKYSKTQTAENACTERNLKTDEDYNGIQQPNSYDTLCSRLSVSLSYVKKHYGQHLTDDSDSVSKEQRSRISRDANRSPNEKRDDDEKQKQKVKNLVCSVPDMTTRWFAMNQQAEDKRLGKFYGTQLPGRPLQEHRAWRLAEQKISENQQYLRHNSGDAHGDSLRDEKMAYTEESATKLSFDDQQLTQDKQRVEANVHADANENPLTSEQKHFDSRAWPKSNVNVYPQLQCQYVSYPACVRCGCCTCIKCENGFHFSGRFKEHTSRGAEGSRLWKRRGSPESFDYHTTHLEKHASDNLSRQKPKFLNGHLPWVGSRPRMRKVQSGEDGSGPVTQITSTNKYVRENGEKQTHLHKHLCPSPQVVASEQFTLSAPRAKRINYANRRPKIRLHSRKSISRFKKRINKQCKFAHSWSASPCNVKHECEISDNEFYSKPRTTSATSGNLIAQKIHEDTTENMSSTSANRSKTASVNISDYSKFAKNGGRVLLFSWQVSDVDFKIKPGDKHNKNSYALLHWSDASDLTKCTRSIFLDLLKRIISQVKPLGFQSTVKLSQNVRDRCHETLSCEQLSPKTTYKETSYSDKAQNTKLVPSVRKAMDKVCASKTADSSQWNVDQKESMGNCDSRFVQRHYFAGYDRISGLNKISLDLKVTRKKKRRPQIEKSDTFNRLFQRTVLLNPKIDVTLTHTLKRNENADTRNLFTSPSTPPYSETQIITHLFAKTLESSKEWEVFLDCSQFSRKPGMRSEWQHKVQSNTISKLFHTIDVFCLENSNDNLSFNNPISW